MGTGNQEIFGVEMKRKNKTKIAFLLSAILIAIGLLEEQNRQVFMKAVKICLECIGIG